MYITEIDNILDQTIDSFFSVWIVEKLKELLSFNTINNEPNYVKFQKEINKTLYF